MFEQMTLNSFLNIWTQHFKPMFRYIRDDNSYTSHASNFSKILIEHKQYDHG